MLTERKGAILKFIVGEYINTALPIASESIAHKHGLGVSPATIRNEMAELEEEGYILRPHISSGGVPTDKGYRHYVEFLVERRELEQEERQTILQQFYQAEHEVEEWVRLAAAVLARLTRNMALVTFPKSRECRLKRLELVSLQKLLALLILVLQEAKVRQQMLPLKEVVTQEELTAVSNRLSSLLSGLTYSEILAKKVPLSSLEEQVVETSIRIMGVEDRLSYEEPYIDGIRHIFRQPEFTSADKVRGIVEVLEDKSLLLGVLPKTNPGERVKVVIGGENKEQVMHPCSVVVADYGLPGDVGGIVGVIGPKRMEYSRIISGVQYLSSLLTELVRHLQGYSEDIRWRAF